MHTKVIGIPDLCFEKTNNLNNTNNLHVSTKKNIETMWVVGHFILRGCNTSL